MPSVGIIGGGAFGTAMACVIRRSGHETVIWAREPEVVASINEDRSNQMFLPGVRVVPGIRATNHLGEAITGKDFILMVVPAQHVRSVALQMRPLVKAATPLVSCSKGIERGTCALMPELIAETLPQATATVLSGPSFAREIAVDLPCGVSLACADLRIGENLAHAIGTPRFRTYLSSDLIGAAIGGAMKNVLAIAAGIVQGKRLGENARATLITRGLAEMIRLGIAKGASPETFIGLCGVGDLVLTCNSMQSRNTSLGVALGEGRKAADVLAARKEVTEGALSAEAVATLAKRLKVDMPITEAVDQVLSHAADIDATIVRLLAHPYHLDRACG